MSLTACLFIMPLFSAFKTYSTSTFITDDLLYLFFNLRVSVSIAFTIYFDAPSQTRIWLQFFSLWILFHFCYIYFRVTLKYYPQLIFWHLCPALIRQTYNFIDFCPLNVILKLLFYTIYAIFMTTWKRKENLTINISITDFTLHLFFLFFQLKRVRSP